MQLADGRLPVLYPRSSPLTLGTSSFIHVGPICSIHIATNGTFGFVCILPMIGSLKSAMTAALLAVRVEVANFHGLTAAVLPLNLHIGLVHIVLPSQRQVKGSTFDSYPGIIIICQPVLAVFNSFLFGSFYLSVSLLMRCVSSRVKSRFDPFTNISSAT